jgi:predicted RND superfamily exporter protein
VSEYGVFANVVAIAGALSSAAAAITLAFMKRSKWQPPEEALPTATSRLAALLSMVVIAILFVFGNRIGIVALAGVTIAFLIIAIVALVVVIYYSTNYSYYYPGHEVEANRKLGGNVLTDEAERIREKKRRTIKQMFDDAQGDKDLVWTRASQTAVSIRTTLSFIALIGFGTCTLAAAAMLVAVAGSSPNPTTKIVCTGEIEGNCPGAHDIFYTCGYFGSDQQIADGICKGIKTGVLRLKTVAGNMCGYALIQVTCRP